MKTRLLIIIVSISIMAMIGIVVFGLAMLTFNFDRDLDEGFLSIVQEYATSSDVERLLIQNQIDYVPGKLVVTGGPVFSGDPGCGAVIDVDLQTHWFEIDSISEPRKMTIYSENPHACVVNTVSCFCNAQMELTALTLDELSYFTPEEEEKYATTLLKYFQNNLGIKKIEHEFRIGKLNLNFTDSTAIGYCGELAPKIIGMEFFSGAIVNGYIKDYGLDRESPPLCAISDDAKWWERK